MDFTPLISQVWGIPSCFIPTILLLALLKSPWTKDDSGDLLVRLGASWQLNKLAHHPTAERQCLKCGSPLLVRDVKSGVKAGPQYWGSPTILSTPPHITFDLQGSTKKCCLPATIASRKINSALINFDTEKTNASENQDLYEPGTFALTLSLTSSIHP